MPRPLDPGALAHLLDDEVALAAGIWNDASTMAGLVVSGDVDRAADAVRAEIARCIRLVAARGRPHELEAGRYAARARRHGVLCARAHLPVSRLLAALESASGLLQVVLWGNARVGDARLHAVTDRALTWLAAVSDAAVTGYAAELGRTGRVREAASALAACLVLGHRAPALAQLAGTGAATHWCGAVAVSPAAVAPWRDVGFVRELDAVPALLHTGTDGDLVLLHPVEARRALGSRLGRLVAHPAVGPASWGLLEPVPVERLPGARQRARRTAELAYAADLPGGRIATPADVVVEDLALGDSVVRPWLDDVGDRLAADPDLLRTVALLYRTDLDRGRTAVELGIARRTLNSRLNRVQQLTGLGPTTSTGIQVLGLAIAARRLGEVRGPVSWALR